MAAIETVLALRNLAGDRVSLELIAPRDEFLYRPLVVAAAFDMGEPPRFSLGAVAADLHATHRRDTLVAVQPERHIAWTGSGAEVPYDMLVVATGTRSEEAVPGALTFAGIDDRQKFAELMDQLERNDFGSVVFAVPSGTSWSLAIYELALIAAARLRARGKHTSVKLVTPEEAPLALFGRAASDAVAELLAARGVELITSTHPVEFRDDALTTVPEGGVVADWVVALPRLRGPSIEGVPADDAGFIEVDPLGQVIGLADVYAAGDVTAGSIKQGGIATQQADTVATAIAARSGSSVEPKPFRPVLRGMLLTGDGARFMRNEVTGGAGESSEISTQILWWPEGKIAGQYLSQYLSRHAQPIQPKDPLTAGAIPVDVELVR